MFKEGLQVSRWKYALFQSPDWRSSHLELTDTELSPHPRVFPHESVYVLSARPCARDAEVHCGILETGLKFLCAPVAQSFLSLSITLGGSVNVAYTEFERFCPTSLPSSLEH